MDIDLGGKVKPSFPKDQFDWYVRNGITEFIKLVGKRPAESGRRKKTHKYSSIYQHTWEGFNIGVLIPHGVVILDVDKGKGGFEAADRLLNDAYGPDERPSIDDIIKSTLTVRSGGGGLHLYFAHDPAKKARGSLKGYHGIDLKTSANQYVVAPGGVHPDTGRSYTIENLPERLAELPEALAPYVLESIRNPLDKGAITGGHHPKWGAAKLEELSTLLSSLDPLAYKSYDAWFALLAAVHHASGGSHEAMLAFIDWSEGDEEYLGKVSGVISKKWEGLSEARDGSRPVATVDTLLATVAASSREATLLGEHGKLNAKADAVALDLRHRIEASDLEALDGSETANMRAYIATLDDGWYRQAPALLHELAVKISELPDDHWPELSCVLSDSAKGEQSPLQIERLIKKKAEARKKAETKAKPTQAEIVDVAARRALKALVPDSRDLLRPPKASFYIYRDGYWQHFHEDSVAKSCFDELDKFIDKSEKSIKPLPYYTREAFNQISYMAGTESTMLYDRKELPSCVNLKNGTLWFYNDGTYELKPHRREDFLTTRLPYSYDPEAACPSMDTMLEQVFDPIRVIYGEAEMREMIRHFWEFAGYALSPKKDIPMIMFWLGEGLNGKSKLAGIISNLFDSKALLSTDLPLILDPSNKHGSATLEGKLLAIDDDVGDDVEISDRIFKKICQSKLYDINPKNKDSRQIMLQTIVLLIANNGAKIVDTSPGFSRRCYVIEFLADLNHLQTSELPDVVELLEMPGVLNKAINGLARLRKRGSFDVPRCAQDSKARFMVASNSILSFWESLDKVERDGSKTKVQSLYNSYVSYMSGGNYGKPSSIKAFVKALNRQKIAVKGENVIGWQIAITA